MKPRTAAFTFTDGEGWERLFRLSAHVLASDDLVLQDLSTIVSAHRCFAYGVISAHTAKQIIYVVTVMEATPVAATAIVLTVVSDALSWAELYSRLAP